MSTPTNIPETPMGETVPDSFLESKEKFHLQLQDIFQNIMRLTGPDQFDQLCQWMEYKQYLTIDDFYDSSYKDPDKFDTKGPATEYKVKGKMNHISPNVAQKLKGFVRWMTHEERPYELHDGFLATLTRESYLKFRHLDTQPPPTLPPSHHESQQHMTSFPSELKQPTHSESKTALNNFKNPIIKVINGEVLFVLHPLTQLIKLIRTSQPHDVLEDVLKLQVKFLLGFEEGVRDSFTHWCFGNVGRGAHVEVVKGVI